MKTEGATLMDYKTELEQIRSEHGGVLRAADVVEYARDPETALHQRFEWNDTKAAEQYRLWQARELIRVVVQTRPANDAATRVYVSLTDDRRNDGGGYRTLDEVMRSKTMREALLKQAHADMVRFETTYRQLSELASVIAAMRSARKQHAPSR
jgi:hypothetical protein